MDCFLKTLLFWLILLPAAFIQAQELTQYERFTLEDNELYWQYTYSYQGKADSVRVAVEQMLKSSKFTFHVIRGKGGYSGKINHYHVNPKRYGRTYLNTPKAYWDGEWSGKFVVEMVEGGYTVTVYALQFSTKTQSVGHYKPDKIRAGKYIDEVTTNNKQSLLKSEFPNMNLMSVSLKDNFDITKTMIGADDQ